MYRRQRTLRDCDANAPRRKRRDEFFDGKLSILPRPEPRPARSPTVTSIFDNAVNVFLRKFARRRRPERDPRIRAPCPRCRCLFRRRAYRERVPSDFVEDEAARVRENARLQGAPKHALRQHERCLRGHWENMITRVILLFEIINRWTVDFYANMTKPEISR